MSTPSSPPHSPEPTSARLSHRTLSNILGVVAILAFSGTVLVLVMIATSEVSLGTLASFLIVVAFFAAIGSFVLRRNFFQRP
jgi:hypothetical protein